MQRKTRFGLTFMVLVLTMTMSVPCALASEKASNGEKKEDSGQEVRKELSETYDAIKKYGFEKKDEFAAWADDRIKVLDKKIAELKVVMDKAKAETKENWKENMEALKAERKELGEKLDALKKSSKGAWEDMKGGFSAAYEKLEQAYEKAADKFKKESEDKEQGGKK